MNEIVMFKTYWCPFCWRAEPLLRSKGIRDMRAARDRNVTPRVPMHRPIRTAAGLPSQPFGLQRAAVALDRLLGIDQFDRIYRQSRIIGWAPKFSVSAWTVISTTRPACCCGSTWTRLVPASSIAGIAPLARGARRLAGYRQRTERACRRRSRPGPCCDVDRAGARVPAESHHSSLHHRGGYMPFAGRDRAGRFRRGALDLALPRIPCRDPDDREHPCVCTLTWQSLDRRTPSYRTQKIQRSRERGKCTAVLESRKP